MSEKQKQPGTKKTAGYSLKVNTQHASRRSFSAHQKGTADAFIRDRDQILGSMAFRRLAGKAQVFITGVDDHMRTRLTHTLEVSRIARTIAAPLRLDVDLVEAIALGHDLGHTPFGHVGERTLHEIMTPGKNHVLGPRCPMNDPADPNRFAELQGFKHNLQSLAVAMKLERSYAGFGMDLTNFTLCGMMSHSSPAYKPGRIANHDHLGYYDAFLGAGCTGPDGRAAWSLEGLLVAEADEIAQYYHDVEDALFGGLITPREIVKIMKKHFDRFGIFRGITRSERSLLNSPEEHDPGEFIAFLSRRLVRMLVDRIIRTASHQLNHLAAEHQLNNLNFEEFRARHSPDDEIIRRIFSYQFPPQEQEAPDGFADQVREFQRTITRRVLSSHDIQKADARGKTIITRLFRAYYDTPEQLPDACVYELLSERSVLAGGPDIEWKLRREARKEGVGSIRQRFADLFRDRSDPQLEMLLMRVICNHIAGMTDERARRTYTELCG